MKRNNRTKKIIGGAAAVVFWLAVAAVGQAFGQRECYVPRSGGGTSGAAVGGALGGAAVKNPPTVLSVAAPNCQAAVGSLRSAGLLIYGFELKPNDPAADRTLIAWLGEIEKTPVWAARFKEGFTASDGLKFLKERFASVGDGWLEIFLGTITEQVYGRAPTPAEKSFYVPRLKAQQETYASIFLAEKNKLAKNPAERKATIDRAYQATMGRAARDADFKYWLARGEVYREIVAAGREWLYSPNGANDLKETVTRAYQAKYKNSPVVEARIAKLTADFSKSKMIYAEMVKP